MDFLNLYILFWLFSFLGWIMEVIVCSISDKKFVNRGFLLGPYCPIYGFGGVLMLLLSPYKDSPIICFVLAMIICSMIEYIASYLMEKLFKVRWWDYSHDAFNINGRICLRNAIAFGALGLAFTSYLNPLFLNYINLLSSTTITIIGIIIFVITLLDIIISCKAMDRIEKSISTQLNSLINKDATNDIKEMIRGTLLSHDYFERRIVKAYQYFNYQKKELKEKVDYITKRIGRYQYIHLIFFILIGILIGVIIGFFTKKYRISFILGLLFGIIVSTLNSRSEGEKNGK